MIKNVKIKKITIGGTDYPAFVNLRLFKELSEKGLDITAIFSDEGPQMWENFAELVKMVIDKGYEAEGKNETISVDDILDSVDVASLNDLTDQIAVLLGSKERTVEAEPPKN